MEDKTKNGGPKNGEEKLPELTREECLALENGALKEALLKLEGQILGLRGRLLAYEQTATAQAIKQRCGVDVMGDTRVNLQTGECVTKMGASAGEVVA